MHRSPIAILAVAATAALTGIATGQTAPVYQQLPAGPSQSGPFANINATYSLQRIADNFYLPTDSVVTEISWWGFMYSPATNQQVGLTNLSGFQVQIFRSSGPTVPPGVPGTALVYSETIPVTSLTPNPPTGFGPGAFGGPTYQFHAVLSTPVALAALTPLPLPQSPQTYWLAVNAILNSGASNADVYSWMYQGGGGGTPNDGHFATDGLLSDPVDGVFEHRSGPNMSFQIIALVDLDGDGLSDADEIVRGTNPSNPDTDGDGLQDGTEVDLAASGSCLDPLSPDVDGDGLLDGEEVVLGLDPCSTDTDGDGLDDWLDPQPLVSLVSSDQIALAVRDVADYLTSLDVSLFEARNENAAAAKRNALATLLQNAANQIERNGMAGGLTLVEIVRRRVDGEQRPNDWLLDSSEQNRLLMYLDELLAVIRAQ